MSVTVLSLPERDANSAASLSDSRSCCSSRAWKMQRAGWPFLRSMRQVRPSVNWRRHLLLFGSRESDFIGDLSRDGFAPPGAGRPQRHEEHREKRETVCLWDAAEACSLRLGAESYRSDVTAESMYLSI